MREVVSGDLKVITDLNIKYITSLYISIEAQKHGICRMRGVLEEGMDAQQALAAKEDMQLTVFQNTESREILFRGLVKEVKLYLENGFTYVNITAVTASELLDRKKNQKSFQNKLMTYKDAVKRVIEPYGNMMVVYMPESEDTLESPVIQYGETDWEFIIRLGSRLHIPVYADYLSGEAGFKFGMAKGELVNAQVNSYHAGVSSQYYKGRNNMPRENYLYYTIISDENFQIGDKFPIGGCTYTIFKKCAELVCEKLKFTYWAGNSGNWYIPEIEHRWLSGMEFTGTVVDAKEETVNIRLKMDEPYGGAEHEWNWEPVSGNIMYGMPEKGSRVRLCFGSEKAEEGSAEVSIRENGGSMPEQQNRGFMPKPGKKLEMYPENVSFSGKGGEASVSDGDKIFFNSAGKMKITASDIIRFEASSISIQTPLEINMYKSAAQSEKRKEDICERGTRSNPPTGGDDSGFTMNFEFNSLSRSGVLCGNEFIRYRPFQDSPEEIITEKPEINMGELWDKMAGSLALAAGVTILFTYGASLVFSGGATASYAPYVVGGLAGLGGCTCVMGQVNRDIRRGEISSGWDYVAGGLGGVTYGALAGGTFCMAPMEQRCGHQQPYRRE